MEYTGKWRVITDSNGITNIFDPDTVTRTLRSVFEFDTEEDALEYVRMNGLDEENV